MDRYTNQDLRGGVKSVLIVSADADIKAVFSSEGVNITLPSDEVTLITPDDDSALWSDTLSRLQGTRRVEHKLEFTLPMNHPATELLQHSTKGVIAVVELTCGTRLLGGYSEEFGAEQPLKASLLKNTSGRTREDDPLCKVTLTAIDTSAARVCTLTLL
ncbi:MAG: hypothetical protein J6V43_00105 [Rikenellaceae bacterium]|nr:hypothetical protein [Rikenellaceae bacterium]